MMNSVREKLMELIRHEVVPYFAERLADHLIANGVTVQRWIPVTERLPEHGDVVLCFMKFGEQRILQWDNVSNWWLGYGHGDDWQKADVTHWRCLPQPPKGDSNG